MSKAIEENEPMTLAEACDIVFRGTIKPATLRAEAARGNLVIERIGRRDFVTRAALNEMREKCRVQPREPDFGSTRNQSSTTSATDRASVARAAALRSARELRDSSRPTSSKNTNLRQTVARLGS